MLKIHILSLIVCLKTTVIFNVFRKEYFYRKSSQTSPNNRNLLLSSEKVKHVFGPMELTTRPIIFDCNLVCTCSKHSSMCMLWNFHQYQAGFSTNKLFLKKMTVSFFFCQNPEMSVSFFLSASHMICV